MQPSVQSLGIDQLSRDERLILVQEIWDTIAAEAASPVCDDAKRQKTIEQRVAEDDAQPDEVVPWEQVKAQAMSRLRRQ